MNDFLEQRILGQLELLVAMQQREISENQRVREKLELVLDDMLANRNSAGGSHRSSRNGYPSESTGSKYSDVAGQMTSEEKDSDRRLTQDANIL